MRWFPAIRLFRFDSQRISATALPIRVGAYAFAGFLTAGLTFAGLAQYGLATIFLLIASLALIVFMACVMMRNSAQARIDSETIRAVHAALAEGDETPAMAAAA